MKNKNIIYFKDKDVNKVSGITEDILKDLLFSPKPKKLNLNLLENKKTNMFRGGEEEEEEKTIMFKNPREFINNTYTDDNLNTQSDDNNNILIKKNNTNTIINDRLEENMNDIFGMKSNQLDNIILLQKNQNEDKNINLLNKKQVKYIKMRLARRKYLEQFMQKKNTKYAHESRHKHAIQRRRAPSGRFLTKAEMEELDKQEK